MIVIIYEVITDEVCLGVPFLDGTFFFLFCSPSPSSAAHWRLNWMTWRHHSIMLRWNTDVISLELGGNWDGVVARKERKTNFKRKLFFFSFYFEKFPFWEVSARVGPGCDLGIWGGGFPKVDFFLSFIRWLDFSPIVNVVLFFFFFFVRLVRPGFSSWILFDENVHVVLCGAIEPHCEVLDDDPRVQACPLKGKSGCHVAEAAWYWGNLVSGWSRRGARAEETGGGSECSGLHEYLHQDPRLLHHAKVVSRARPQPGPLFQQWAFYYYNIFNGVPFLTSCFVLGLTSLWWW